MVPASHLAGSGAGARVAVPCDCTAGGRATRLFDRARIPARYLRCDFHNFETDLYESEPSGLPWNHSLQQAKLLVQGFARDYAPGAEHGILLMGPSGVGKTHLEVAALKELLDRGHDALFYDYRELLKEIQASYNPVSQTSEMEVLEPVLSVEVLLLDDLGSTKPSEWVLDTVGHILNARYNEKRVTLITTNYPDGAARARQGSGGPRLPSGQAVALRDDTLADRIGRRMRSRLFEMCRTVEIAAPDYREKIRRAWPLEA
jgi:DNA replication protein DnaC